MFGRIFKYTVADRNRCIMAEMRGTSLDNSSPDSAVWRDNSELERASLPVLPHSHSSCISLFTRSSDLLGCGPRTRVVLPDFEESSCATWETN